MNRLLACGVFVIISALKVATERNCVCPYSDGLKDSSKMNSQRKTNSQRTMVCLFSACVLAALVLLTQNGASAFNGGAATWQDAAGQEPTAGNTKTPSG